MVKRICRIFPIQSAGHPCHFFPPFFVWKNFRADTLIVSLGFFPSQVHVMMNTMISYDLGVPEWFWIVFTKLTPLKTYFSLDFTPHNFAFSFFQRPSSCNAGPPHLWSPASSSSEEEWHSACRQYRRPPRDQLTLQVAWKHHMSFFPTYQSCKLYKVQSAKWEASFLLWLTLKSNSEQSSWGGEDVCAPEKAFPLPSKQSKQPSASSE